MLCNDDGGVIDDVIAYKWGSEGIYVVPNAANAATVVAAFRAKAPAGITIDDQQATHGIIAVQGPSSSDVLGVAHGHGIHVLSHGPMAGLSGNGLPLWIHR